VSCFFGEGKFPTANNNNNNNNNNMEISGSENPKVDRKKAPHAPPGVAATVMM